MAASNLFPVFFIDPPKILDTAVTPIPAASDAPVEVVANSGRKAAYAIDYIDTTGAYTGVYTGVVLKLIRETIESSVPNLPDDILDKIISDIQGE